MDVLGIGWQPSSFHGWGVFGLNLAEQMLVSGRARPLFVSPVDASVIDPPARQAELLAEALAVSAGLAESADFDGRGITIDVPLVLGLAADFRGLPVRSSVAMHAVTFQERAVLSDAARARAREFETVIAGSSWLGRWLAGEGVENVTTVLQGVDPALFRPQDRAETEDGADDSADGGAGDTTDGGAFRVFSGGKMEYRKGQDLVIAAFRRFRARHPEARLVFSWDNPYSGGMESVAAGGHVTPPPDVRPETAGDVARWLAENGLPEGSFENLGSLPNRLMPDALASIDVGVFPSRCEGGTNLVAMECMASGVPAVLSANTGHLDLIDGDNCYALTEQAPVDPAQAGDGTGHWGESSVDELTEALEAAYRDRRDASRRGARGAETLARLSWETQAGKLLDAIGW
ncbi:MAG: glycosyltransferase family 4 protein [Rhodospirillales bacterium]